MSLSQSFGAETSVNEADTITAVEFDGSGDFLATGDRGGRIVLFTKNSSSDSEGIFRRRSGRPAGGSDSHSHWLPFFQFQSHEPEFDYLKSLEIEEKINQIKFCRVVSDSVTLLSTNDKTVKLWKVNNRRNYVPCCTQSIATGGGLRLPMSRGRARATVATPVKIFQNAHTYHINSINTNSDGETFVSADDLRINWWHLECSDKSFNVVDIKPKNMEELTEVITAVRLHPQSCNIVAYSTSRGLIKVGDTRASALCDRGAKSLEVPEDLASKSFFSEIISSISDINFSPNDGRYIMSRDYMTIKIWDLNMENRPVKVIDIHDYLKPALSDLYENDCIFDKFEAVVSGDGTKMLTGSYSNRFSIWNNNGRRLESCQLPSGALRSVGVDGASVDSLSLDPSSASSSSRSTNGGTVGGGAAPNNRNQVTITTTLDELPGAAGGTGTVANGANSGSRTVTTNIRLDQKVLHVAWHPTDNLVAVAGQAGLYMYIV